MIDLKERYIVDARGQRVGVILDLEAYQSLLDALEELESVRVYDGAMSEPDDSIPFEQAIQEIESDRH